MLGTLVHAMRNLPDGGEDVAPSPSVGTLLRELTSLPKVKTLHLSPSSQMSTWAMCIVTLETGVGHKPPVCPELGFGLTGRKDRGKKV